MPKQEVKKAGEGAPEVPAGTPAGEEQVETTAGEAEDIAARLEQAEQQCAELSARNLRLQADYDNLRRRTRQEKEELVGRATENLIIRLLPVLDDLERALTVAAAGVDDEGSLLAGVQMVYRALMGKLAEEGLEAVPGAGAAFDPHLHEAVARADAAAPCGAAAESDVVTEVFRAGYKLAGRVIRPAMVKVGPAPAAPAPTEAE